MAGGTFTAQDKLRPGAYINFENGQIEDINLSGNLMTMPLELDFGPEQEVVPVTKSNVGQFGQALSHANMLLLKEAFKRVDVVLVYRVNKGEKAKATDSAMKIEANHSGVLGNSISIVAKATVDDPTNFLVETYVAGALVHSQSARKIDELAANTFVTFSGTGDLEAVNVTLTGGTNGTTTVDDYAGYFEALEVYEFAYMALPVSDTAITQAAVSYIERLRDKEGKKCQLVVAGVDADHESVINVKNGAKLADGTLISAAQATAWVAAASTAIGYGKSLTQQVYEDAVDANPRLSNQVIEEGIRLGQFMFTPVRNTVRVETDINSLHTLSDDKKAVWAKNEAVRTFDYIANDTKKVFEDNYIGKVGNNADGREGFRANRILFFESLQNQGAIQDFDKDSVQVSAGEQPDGMVLTAEVTILNNVEKLYMTVTVQ